MSLSYFVRNIGAIPTLYVTDGTVAGARAVQGFSTGTSVSVLLTASGRVYFSANDGTNGTELWTSNGTAAGTYMLSNISPAGSSNPSNVFNVEGTVYFAATTGTTTGLYRTDGSQAGTSIVKSFAGGYPDWFTNLNGQLIFEGNDGATGAETWVSDGTTIGTHLLVDLFPGATGSVPFPFFVLNGKAYFDAAQSAGQGYELFVSDGTAANTSLVKDISPAGSSVPGNFVSLNGILYFSANDGTTGYELWRSDGTSAGTFIVRDIYSGLNSGVLGSLGRVSDIVDFHNELYFTGDDGTHGYELWNSNGTTLGTSMLVDINNVGTTSSSPAQLTATAAYLYFTANDGTNGTELWRTDGTVAGAIMVKDINPTGSSAPVNLTPVTGGLEFEAYDGTNYNLYFTNGQAGNATLLASNVYTGSPIQAAPSGIGLTTDVNGDGASDILWQNTNGTMAIWEQDGAATIAATTTNPGVSWHLLGSGDFSGDGNSDLLWQNDNSTPVIWEMNGTKVVGGGALPAPGSGWKLFGTGDFNHDGMSDIGWQNSTTGQLSLWEMNGANVINSSSGSNLVPVNPGANWHAVTTGDFYGNGDSDIAYQNTDGTVAIWEMNGTSLIGGGTVANPGASWKLLGAGDFNEDGTSDLLFQNTDGTVAVWDMNGSSIVGAAIVANPGTAWHVLGAGDYSGYGAQDNVMFQNTNGEVVTWQLWHNSIASSTDLGNPGASWKPVFLHG